MGRFTWLDNVTACMCEYTPTQLVGVVNAGCFTVPDTGEHFENCYTEVWGVPASQRVYTVLREYYGITDSVKLETIFSSLPKAAKTSNGVLRYSIVNTLKNM